MSFLKNLFNKGPKIEKVEVAKRYQLHARVGQGSMSKVWKATDPINNDLVAIKVLDKAKLFRLNQRFVGMNKPTEGEIAVVLNHPNVVKTHTHGITTEDEEFLVMEFVEGLSMSYLVETQNEQMQENCIWYCIQVGEGLNYLHLNDWIHRDLCPRNIVVSEDEIVKIIDFGLMLPQTPEFRKPGNRTGTANYMAPELIMRQPTDQRIDVFSYAVTCFEMFSGQLPWPSADTMESVLHHINQPPEDIRKFAPDLDEQIAQAIMTGLEKNPDDRWRTTRRMVNEFREAAERLYPE
ncbi:serine/threonine protein kinase [Planctomicrobium sp.]|jgi:eukaryotic-like serine/threonine-protein kinase|nr:serine/threonine-protein kinase [Planctomicrobium sp.]MBT5019172.1 serine/threonine protein kinase [Planctomicrobium sp.]MDB4439393.1 serine/threonine protein kinase [Planctomicrobium sp.]MDB4743022.1 serine/threonine protein kinase [Planctomicrobium sp.]